MKPLFLFLVAMFAGIFALHAEVITHISMPASDEVHRICFGRNGLLWIATSSGIKSYDGYEVQEPFIHAARQCPQLGSGVKNLTEDHDGYLWAGTYDGLVRLDPASGEPELYRFPKKSQQIIYALFTAQDGTVYVGTDDGFSVYNKENDSFVHYNMDNAKAVMPDGRMGRYGGYGVKDFVEAPGGDILIGTWQQGLWRYSPKTKTIRGYERLNPMNSAFALCMDHTGRLYIGTQGYGLQCLDRIDDYRLQTLRTVSDGSKERRMKFIYDLAEDANGQIYSCTADTNSATVGSDGALWLTTRSSGIVRMAHNDPFFNHYASGDIRSLYSDNGTQFYLGYGMKGIAWIDLQTGDFRTNNRVPGYASLPEEGFTTQVTSMVRRWNGELWMDAGDNGVFISYPDGTSQVCYPKSMPYVRDNVLTLYESDRDRTLWIGQRQGVSVLLRNGRGFHLEGRTGELDLSGYFIVNHITEDHEGNIWVSSSNKGIVRISGDPADTASLRYRQYIPAVMRIAACFEDSRHRLWAVGSAGLLKYNREKDCFESTADYIHLAGKKVLAINEDVHGALWLPTERALNRLTFMADGTPVVVCFTEQDGLPSTSFLPNSTFRYGNRLFFGTDRGFVGFDPPAVLERTNDFTPNLLITDIWIDGTPFRQLDSLEAVRISSLQPLSTQRITIPSSVKKFGIGFSLLCYGNQEETQYAYRLEGYHSDWQYASGQEHRALFENIPSGTYRFHLRAADSRGRWYDLPYSIEVYVEPPFYATWWACLLYLLLLGCISWFVYDWLRMRREAQSSRQISNVLRGLSPMEESNPDGLFMQRALKVITDHLSDSDFNRDVFAQEMNMSLSALYEKLRRLTGLSIQTYISTVRLNAACEILKQEPDIRISELAYRVGFNTPKYFSQCFKKEFGLLPKEFVHERASGKE